ncbi:hypothetical protein IPF37_04545 [bacterium]|nr:MAG: hypothetical protein IPF37_04545 [bacterium]
MINTFMSCWKESILFFSLHNLNAIVVAFGKALVAFVKKLWFLIFLLLGLQAFEIFNSLVWHKNSTWSMWNLLINAGVYVTTLGCFFMFLWSVRPSASGSLAPKHRDYSLQFFQKVVGFIALMVLAPLGLALATIGALFIVELSSEGATGLKLFVLGIINSIKFALCFLPGMLLLTFISFVPDWLGLPLFAFRVPWTSGPIAQFLAYLPHAVSLLVPMVISLCGLIVRAFLISVCATFFIQLKGRYSRLFN